MDSKKTFSKEFREDLMKGEIVPISSSIFALGMAADTGHVTKAMRSMSEQPGPQVTPKTITANQLKNFLHGLKKHPGYPYQRKKKLE